MTARRVAWWVGVVALAVGTSLAATLGGWQLLLKSQHPIRDSAAARKAATEAASAGAVAVLSYSPDTLENDFAAAESHLTGDFLSYYRQFTKDVVAPAAHQKIIKTSAVVRRAGVETLTDHAGSVLLFVDQTTTSRDRPDPTATSSAINVGLAKVNGAWLIDSFNPT